MVLKSVIISCSKQLMVSVFRSWFSCQRLHWCIEMRIHNSGSDTDYRPRQRISMNQPVHSAYWTNMFQIQRKKVRGGEPNKKTLQSCQGISNVSAISRLGHLQVLLVHQYHHNQFIFYYFCILFHSIYIVFIFINNSINFPCDK